jgi:hypothetical protein
MFATEREGMTAPQTISSGSAGATASRTTGTAS